MSAAIMNDAHVGGRLPTRREGRRRVPSSSGGYTKNATATQRWVGATTAAKDHSVQKKSNGWWLLVGFVRFATLHARLPWGCCGCGRTPSWSLMFRVRCYSQPGPRLDEHRLGAAVQVRRVHQHLQHASRSVSPDGGQFDFVWLPARTMHPHGAYVRVEPDETKKPRKIPTRKRLPRGVPGFIGRLGRWWG